MRLLIRGSSNPIALTIKINRLRLNAIFMLLQKATLEVTSGAKSAEEPAKAWVSQPDGVKSEAKGFWLPPERGGA
jgi:hypothetical protein